LAKGIGTIVDLTTADMGRDIHYLSEWPSARASTSSWLPVYWIVPRYWNRDIESLVRVFVKDITEGIQGTDVALALSSSRDTRQVE
jgi:predicted metal-dependent phosphotriesterase family hydrolase